MYVYANLHEALVSKSETYYAYIETLFVDPNGKIGNQCTVTVINLTMTFYIWHWPLRWPNMRFFVILNFVDK